MTKLDLGLLCMNCFVLGGLLVVMIVRGPSGPTVLLAIGTAGMAIAKFMRALWAIEQA